MCRSVNKVIQAGGLCFAISQNSVGDLATDWNDLLSICNTTELKNFFFLVACL